jgi:hypothetical protein
VAALSCSKLSFGLALPHHSMLRSRTDLRAPLEGALAHSRRQIDCRASLCFFLAMSCCGLTLRAVFAFSC